MQLRKWTIRRRPYVAAAGLMAMGLVVAACSAGGSAAVTVTSNVTVPGTTPVSSSSATSATSIAGQVATTTAAPTTSTTAVPTTRSSTVGTSPGPTTSSVPTATTGGGVPAGGTEPDGFKITRLAPGEKPPQFIVVSFDGVGWHQKWQYWKGIGDQVPFHFTGFLSGTYMLSDQTKDDYHGPGHAIGKSSINWNTATDLPVEISDINAALAGGDEIGTHFNGHFCADNRPGGNDWNTGDWNDELDQFFSLVKNVNTNNQMTEKLNLPAGEIKGERTPCLEGHATDLFPALVQHGMTYDSSFTKPGISWPHRSAEYKIWQFGMAEFPMHGTGHTQITMDYNFWFTQENNTTATPAKAAQDSAQVTATYQDMYNATFNGNRAPLVLGNHFNEWNNNAYSDAIANFVLANCGKPDTKCVPFRDVIDWMNAQDPVRLAQLQGEGAELGGCPETAFPKCDGKISY